MYTTLREKIAAEKGERQERYARFSKLWAEAWEAGRAASGATSPKPMVVTNMDGTVVEVVPDGMCGFAWLRFKGNTSFAKWLQKHHRTHPGYPSGVEIFISDYGQSYELKRAHASAMASYLASQGIEVKVGSRLD